ncbi:dnaJ homolog subfamily B member 9-like [Bombus affinis]|uniref:dnaJ homolog subfamily B member 9-like n=1 Tax=Bombus affinis TaxID=309941 RepID=UPI0021B79EBA|nr:dnaJ homolog subfamily B member 9-like [Bombus affinis]XP_050586145.1 dnaJ homolog subfamily B member 9-like [Bombus affinis]XP_050586147.1 dnaJ homolog subfamily B member 9-like [Bombus affinis]XP_050586148.1 dnaJ homolog subfamily B member 9-like [Bombus affinis]XP_050586149.1 dnaJ homolog subfamily B member 9-like [Bombus affinis]
MLIHCFLTDINKRVLFKYIKQFMLSLPATANLATKTKTHYEMLGLQPTATYNEIKSAYYELALKYHPDKNKSESAKKMFYDISNAYDVLSKYETRKKYDRTQLINQNLQSLNNKSYKRFKPKDIKQYKNQSKDIFNFDEWVQQHYSCTLQKNLSAKKKQKENMEDSETSHKSPDLLVIIILIILTTLVILVYEYINNKKYEDSKAAQKYRNK